MILNFFIQYNTKPGQSLYLLIYDEKKGKETAESIFNLNYYDENYWHGVIDSDLFNIKNKFTYSCFVSHNYNESAEEIIAKKTVSVKFDKKQDVNIYEQIIQQADYDTIYETKAFDVLFKKDKTYKVKGKESKHPTHIFKISAPVMQNRFAICITGAGDHFNDWDEEKPVILQKKKNHWVAELNLSKEKFPLEYKLALYDFEEKTIVHFEEGDNRVLQENDHHDKISILFHNAPFTKYGWRGAGVNVPVFSLRTKKSWGIGDFTDLHLLADWANATGLKMIQLLPVNDTTATYTEKDSYPYSAISPFALHPLFLNVQKLATAASLEFPAEINTAIEQLNNKPAIDYEGVSDLKMKAIKFIYELEKSDFKNDFGWIEFFNLNRHWLVPYAVFCYLRDKNKTPEFDNWEQLGIYKEDDVQEFASPGTEQYEEICLHYFIQYHLHLQLKDAVDYAHKKNIIYKGDLPIGIGRYSVDTWMYPHLFHLNMQAGAPPDYYSTKGQNWSFPTYNWEMMAADGYQWWRQRMEHLGNYFDAIRIDHVLGFFRIWSIPVTSVEGTLGIFQPVFPVPADVFYNNGIHLLDKDRYCKPFITEHILYEYFGDDKDWISQVFLDSDNFKPEYNTQQKIVAFFVQNKQKKQHEDALLRLLSNVILIEDDQQKDSFHFRINMSLTDSYKNLPDDIKYRLENLYHQYFFINQNTLWEAEGIKKLNALKGTTDMLLCAEDLGMVPDFMENVLKQLNILSLQVQRMPKDAADNFSNPANAPYMSVTTPSTHDMSTVREWWQDERQHIQFFFNSILGDHGEAPQNCEPWVSKGIIEQHLFSPSLWSVFLIQDILGMDPSIRSADIYSERINDPSDPNHVWNYRMHLTLEELIKDKDFTHALKSIVIRSGR
jgi:4-alpha-glucanotransferase